MAGTGILGRQRELELVERFLNTEAGGALLLHGPGGIGKTRLWEHGLQSARERGMQVLVTRCTEQERHLSYAGLADLLGGVDVGSIGSLPPPQLAALEAALLIGPSARDVNPPAVAAALLAVLGLLASAGGLLVAVDDLPWLDEPTAAALAFSARRLAVHFLFAARDDEDSPVTRVLQRSTLERLAVGPLGAAEIRQLLNARLGLVLPRRTTQRIFEASAGNPLYALELGKAVVANSEPELGAELPLTRTLEDELSDHVGQLEPAVRTLLLAVALGPGTAATSMPGIEALDDALESGVVTIDGDRIRPVHPLVGTAAVAAASPAERRDVHNRLAAVAPDDEQRAHHLAFAADLPDGAVAATVAAGAARAMQRGAAASAALLGQHALRLTPSAAAERLDRQLTAAEYLYAAGEAEQGRALVPDRIESLPDLGDRVRAYLLAADLGVASPPLPSERSGRAWTDRALSESQADPVLLAGVLARCASDRAVAELTDLKQLESSLIRAESAEAQLDQVTRVLLISSLAWLRSFRGAALDDLAERFVASDTDALALPLHQGVDRLLALQQMWRGQTSAPRATFSRLRTLADQRGEDDSYLAMRLHLCELELRAGRLDAAAELLDEWAQEMTDGPGQAHAAFARCHALLAAYRGREGEVETWLSRFSVEDEDGAVADRWQWLEAERARGIGLLFAGSAAGALASLRQVWDYTCTEGIADPGIFPVAADLVEAALGARARDYAQTVTEAVTDAAVELGHPWAAATALRCGALLHLGSAEAATELSEAADAYQALGLQFDQARSLHVLATSYRSQRQNERSAKAFERAATLFDQLGSDGWAARSRRELAGSPRPSSEPDGSLTATEEKVARLVATGSRNREVAAALFISQKTVEAHLSHIYAKLGVRSRTELAARLHAQDQRLED
jgi:DNA-binding NarL/FixJ family response regulator